MARRPSSVCLSLCFFSIISEPILILFGKVIDAPKGHIASSSFKILYFYRIVSSYSLIGYKSTAIRNFSQKCFFSFSSQPSLVCFGEPTTVYTASTQIFEILIINETRANGAVAHLAIFSCRMPRTFKVIVGHLII